jgi:WD repeat-containing protein 44
VTRPECLCCFKHSEVVTSIQFHPRDDRFFIAGSLDTKLRLWSIPDKVVACCEKLNEVVTAVEFTPDGKTVIAGTLSGQCLFYETDKLRYHTQMQVKSAHGKNAKGSKITGIQAITYPPNDPSGDVKLLITSNDSRIRVYNLRDRALELKVKGNENSTGQIRASFSEDARYIVCGSEDRKVYIWPTSSQEQDRDKWPMEVFEAHSATVTAAIMAPVMTRQLLQASGDPLFELCNPPPVTLRSRSESASSSAPPAEGQRHVGGIVPNAPAPSKAEESPAYVARSAHPDGNIIVSADYMGQIKVFRQDCAYKKRIRSNDSWNASSSLSRKMLGRSPSIATRDSRHSFHNTASSPQFDRIYSWRQSVGRSSFNTGTSSLNSSHDNMYIPPSPRHLPRRTPSPGKPATRANNDISIHHAPAPWQNQPRSPSSSTPSYGTAASHAADTTPNSENSRPKPPDNDPHHPQHTVLLTSEEDNPLLTDANNASNLFWNRATYEADRQVPLRRHSLDIDGVNMDAGGIGRKTSRQDGLEDPSRLGLSSGGLGRSMTLASILTSEEESSSTDD